MTDQQRFDAMSCHGGWVRTPVLDRLAGDGCDLLGHFAQAPVCVPSRTSLFTGRYPHAHRVLENDARLAAHEVHLFKALKQHGYHLTYTGKNHLLPHHEALANFDGFDDPLEDPAATPERRAYRDLERASLARLQDIGSYASGEYHDFPDEVTTTGRIARQVMAQLETAPPDRPWCVVGSFGDPHVPHLAPRRFEPLYPLENLPLPAWDETQLATKPKRVRIKRSAQNAAAATEADQRRYLGIYGAMCSYVDEQIGLILDRLRARPDADRTVVVFVSDHGDFAWNQGLCKKDLLLYDDLLHVPAILHWPGRIKPRRVADTLTEHIDVVPTLLDLAGIEVPFGCQGRSFAPLLRGETAVHRDEVHAEVCYPWMRLGFDTMEDLAAARAAARWHGPTYNVPGDYTKAVRTREWKYVWFGDGFEELYDLRADPGESTNLAGDTRHAATLGEMRLRLLQWFAQSADPRSPLTEREQLRQFDRWRHVE